MAEKEYIERGAIINRLKASPLGMRDASGGFVKSGIIDLVKRQPAADVVEVVRCKDCKHAHAVDGVEPMYACTNPEVYGIGSRGAMVCHGMEFCSYGERRGEGE